MRCMTMLLAVVAIMAAMLSFSGLPAGAAPSEQGETGWVMAVGEFENGVSASEQAEEKMKGFLD